MTDKIELTGAKHHSMDKTGDWYYCKICCEVFHGKPSHCPRCGRFILNFTEQDGSVIDKTNKPKGPTHEK